MTVPNIRYIDAFIDSPEQLVESLQACVTWDERMKARKTASFGASYNYSQISYLPQPMLPALDAICARLSQTLRFMPNNCLLNFYPDGDASMGFHSDSTEGLSPGTGVAIVSLGSVRSIVFRKKTDRALDLVYPLGIGSLLYMPDDVQHDWLHAIPKAPGAGERISLTFRSILV